ncbi:hypothetical protein [Elioraea sp.]|uniref:hypothetical protein n=1 Tax=Elioraea sp. TaxID=2185103 RepID=UPI0025C2EFA3|nr:hypothetical protein [Elioraea sp.]
MSVTGQARLLSRLQQYLPGVTVNVRALSNGGSPPAYSMVSGTNFIDWSGASDAWWNRAGAAYDTHGGPLRDYILAEGNAARMHVLIHYCNTQDDNDGGFFFNGYRDAIVAAYQKIFDDCAPSFGAFYILPVCNASRGSGGGNLGSIRRIMDALAGYGEPVAGLPRLPFVLRPIYPMGWIPIDQYLESSGDNQHVMRSTARRATEGLALRIAGWNGATAQSPDQPRLCRAVRINATTLRATLVSPGGFPLRRQGAHGFALTGAGSISAVGAFDNSQVATTRYVTCDLTVSGLTSISRLTQFAAYQQSSFANGTTPPRGLLQNVSFADPTGGTLTITDAYEDLLSADPVLMVAQHESGVPVEI